MAVPPQVLSPTAALVADADLLHLARSERWQLLDYEDAIRGEYDDFVALLSPGSSPPPDYCKGRRRLLEILLGRAEKGLLFRNELVSQRYNHRAESNLSYLLGAVEAQSRCRRAT